MPAIFLCVGSAAQVGSGEHHQSAAATTERVFAQQLPLQHKWWPCLGPLGECVGKWCRKFVWCLLFLPQLILKAQESNLCRFPRQVCFVRLVGEHKQEC